jgi:hypothetical protein
MEGVSIPQLYLFSAGLGIPRLPNLVLCRRPQQMGRLSTIKANA